MFFAKVYIPFFAAIAIILVALRCKFSDKHIFTIKLFGLEIDITNKNAARLICLLAAFSVVPYYTYMDFSEFFPEHFEMEVFYDSAGIQGSLSVFSEDELAKIGYIEGNESSCNYYFKALDDKLKQLLSYDSFFSVTDGVVHSTGETSFKVTKTKGIHNYYIEASKGELSHALERARHKRVEFKSFFEKLASASDYIRPTIADIFFEQAVMLRPRFKQVIAEHNKSDGVIFDHTLTGATKVFLFPYPKYSNTVYFFDYGDKGLVPIGYAVYK